MEDVKPFVAVIGGACAGSEIAFQLCEAGYEVVVFEQNQLPYGKIEDGLPRWHEKLRIKEYGRIDEKLSRPGIHYVPKSKLGRDLSLEELCLDWGFSLVVLATGAWRDRPLPVAGLEKVTDDSFLYQNPFVYWFNHAQEVNYSGPNYQVRNGAIVIGGGLASFDVAKILQFTQVRRMLSKRGIKPSLLDMEHYGIDRVLEKEGISYGDLNIQETRIYYRRNVEDMPISPIPDQADESRMQKVYSVRRKLVSNLLAKYHVQVFPLFSPEKVHTQAGTITGITFRRTKLEAGKVIKTEERVVVDTPQIISSIGSVPEILPGLPMEGELFDTEDGFTGALRGNSGVYCVGNAITGKGNIRDSLENARRLGLIIREVSKGLEPDYAALFKAHREAAQKHVDKLVAFLQSRSKPSVSQAKSLMARVHELQRIKGYGGNYLIWRDDVLNFRAQVF